MVQESLLQAFLGLDRLRDPDRFAAWLTGIVLNVHRALRRRPPLTLLADWPEQLHPVAPTTCHRPMTSTAPRRCAQAVADLPAGQRRAVTMTTTPTCRPARSQTQRARPRASLYKARLRLREHITAHRPDLIPASPRRAPMTAVRIAHAEPRPGDLGDGRLAVNQVLVVLADDAGHWAVPALAERLRRRVAVAAGRPHRLGDAALERIPEQLD